MHFHLFCFRSNININDVLGNYSLTLIDTLDTLLVRYIHPMWMYDSSFLSIIETKLKDRNHLSFCESFALCYIIYSEYTAVVSSLLLRPVHELHHPQLQSGY